MWLIVGQFVVISNMKYLWMLQVHGEKDNKLVSVSTICVKFFTYLLDHVDVILVGLSWLKAFLFVSGYRAYVVFFTSEFMLLWLHYMSCIHIPKIGFWCFLPNCLLLGLLIFPHLFM